MKAEKILIFMTIVICPLMGLFISRELQRDEDSKAVIAAISSLSGKAYQSRLNDLQKQLHEMQKRYTISERRRHNLQKILDAIPVSVSDGPCHKQMVAGVAHYHCGGEHP